MLLNLLSSTVQADPGTPTPAPAHVESGAQIQPGQIVTSVLSDLNTPDRFVVFGAYGDLISIGAFPAHEQTRAPSLEIDGPDGSIVGQSDGLTDGVPAALVSALQLPSTGAYIIYVSAADSQALGDYTLIVGSDWTLRDVNGGTLRLDTPAVGKLDRPADRQLWTVRLSAGIQFTLGAQPAGSGLLDPVIEVLSPLGDRLAVAHDASVGHYAQTATLTAPTTGDYLIRVSAYTNQSIGAYDLVARTVTLPSPIAAATAQTIALKVDGQVAAGAQFTQPFQGAPGQVFLIEVRSNPPGAFDAVLELIGPSGRRIALNDDRSPQNVDPLLRVALNDGAGTYLIRVSGYALTGGSFTLIVFSA